MSRVQREALLMQGLPGLLQMHGTSGLWSLYDAVKQKKELGLIDGQGSMPTDRIFALDDFLGTDKESYDSQIGSIGGGNHFCEVQRVSKIYDSRLAYAWGLHKDQVVVMVHSGSVSIGHLTGSYFKELVRKIYPGDMKYPDNGLFILPDSEKFLAERNAFWASFSNAANFAYGNRLFLALMMFQVLMDGAGCNKFDLVYGSGHNLIWPQDGTWLHRKGACTARGPDDPDLVGTPFEGIGEPVIIPGSMGTSSFLLVGNGHAGSMSSASHGAGRTMSRGKASHEDEKKFQEFLDKFTIVTPVDPDRGDFKRRPDILRKWESELKKESPGAYKDIGPIIQTQVDAGIARVVVELEPLMTVKG
jgi:tRNA-splicing ligase RtcB